MQIKVVLQNLLAVSVLSLGVSVSFGESPIRWKVTPGWEPESSYCRLYDAKRVEMLQGKIERVDKEAPLKGMGEGVYFMMKTKTESIPVHLGPADYVEQQTVHFVAGDEVEVTGSRVSCNGKPVLLAARVRKEAAVADYRELKGRPLWAPVTPPAK